MTPKEKKQIVMAHEQGRSDKHNDFSRGNRKAITPKEKAFQLFCKFYRDSDLLLESLSRIEAKECALIAVDEVLKSEPRIPNDVDWDDCGGTHQYYYEAQREDAEKFWQEVIQEVEKL